MKNTKLLKIVVIINLVVVELISFLLAVINSMDKSLKLFFLIVGVLLIIIAYACWYRFTKLTAQENPLRYKITIISSAFALFAIVLAVVLGAKLEINI